jgi:hypothetical protein
MNILIVSVNAGGGHTAAMHSLLLSLQRFAPDVNVASLTSPNRILEPIHRLAYTKGSYLYNAFYKATAHSTALCKAYFAVTYPSIRSFSSELAPLLGEYEAVISTHFMQTYALLKAKHSRRLLAAVFRSADATVLASVARATLYELMEAKAGPLLVHRINPGPEP